MLELLFQLGIFPSLSLNLLFALLPLPFHTPSDRGHLAKFSKKHCRPVAFPGNPAMSLTHRETYQTQANDRPVFSEGLGSCSTASLILFR